MKKKNDIVIVKKIFSLLKPFAKKIVVVIVCIIISAGISMVLPLISKQVMDDGLLKGNLELIVILTAVSLLLIITDQGVGLIETRFFSYINSILPFNLLKKAFGQLLKLKIRYFNNTNFAEIMSNMSMDIGNMASVSDRSTFFLIAQVFKIIGGLVGLIVFIDWRLTILVIAVMPVNYLVIKVLAKKTRKLFEKYMEDAKEYSSWFGDTIGGMKEIRLFGLDNKKTAEFIQKQRPVIKTQIRMNILGKINEVAETVLFQVITSLAYILGAYLIFNNALSLGKLFAFLTYFIYVTGPISSILHIGYNFSKIIPSAARFFNFLDMECEEDVKTLKKQIHVHRGQIRPAIRYENVTFSYHNGINKNVLENISFEITEKEKVAIIGQNGSGKSTLVNLLLRFYHPDTGRIFLDGRDIHEIRLKDYRSLFSVVNQDFYLFNASIRENITLYSKVDETLLNQAAFTSQAHDFVQNMTEKYDSRIGRDGSKLSGGERQKIAVARALARDSEILVFDEPTSNYDRESEIKFNESLETDFREKTVIVISHKPDILRRCGRIIVLENGKIKSIGKHEELMKEGYYREIVKKQQVDDF